MRLGPVSDPARISKRLRAIQLLKTACLESPRSGRLRIELAGALAAAGHIRGATNTYLEAFEKGFRHPVILTNLGAALFREGRIPEAVIAYRAAITRDPSFQPAWSNLLLALNCLDGIEPRELAREHQTFGDIQPASLPVMALRRPGKLRLGYVSGSFFRHPVTTFFEPVLKQHDRERFEVFCYQANHQSDRVTARLVPLANHWRLIASMSRAEAIDLVRRDDIDLLVDLDGHTGDNRLDLFSEHAGRVQVAWLGYPNTTGLKSMNYRVTDFIADPVPLADELHRETLLRLAPPFLVFARPRNSPKVSAAPLLRNGYVTFGMFNQIHKLSGGAVSAIAQILRRVDNSQFILKSMAFVDQQVCDSITERFAECGVDAARIRCAGPVKSHRAHLEAHHAVDIMLDSFPYTGTTTTCEALWMGTPVVTLQGATHRERVTSSLLHCMGLSRFVAKTVEEYIAIAADLASQPHEISAVRKTMRRRMQASPLMDVPHFTRRFECALASIAENPACARKTF